MESDVSSQLNKLIRPLIKRENLREVMKLARSRGEEFVTDKGHLVEGKKTGPDCGCKKACTAQFTDDEKNIIIKKVFSGRTKNERDIYLMGLIEVHDVKRHRPKNEHSKQIPHSFKYFTMQGSHRIEICQKAFLSLHGVSGKAVFRLTKFVADNNLPNDLRGKRVNHVGMHILFPLTKSH